MQQRTVITKGKKYIVNCVGFGDAIGSGGSVGTLWMQSTDKNWYAVNASGISPAVNVSVNQSPLTWQSPGNDVGNQLLLCDDGNSYVVYLTGSPPNVTFTVNQSPFMGSAQPKPDLLLQSITDGNFYIVTLHKTSSGSIGYTADTTLITSDTTLITTDSGGSSSGSISSLVNQTPIPASMIIF